MLYFESQVSRFAFWQQHPASHLHSYKHSRKLPGISTALCRFQCRTPRTHILCLHRVCVSSTSAYFFVPIKTDWSSHTRHAGQAHQMQAGCIGSNAIFQLRRLTDFFCKMRPVLSWNTWRTNLLTVILTSTFTVVLTFRVCLSKCKLSQACMRKESLQSKI